MHHDIEHLLAQPFGSLPELIAQQAAHRPRHTALVLGTQSLDYAALRAGMDRVARSLQQDGFGPGDVVAICAGTSVEYVLTFLGALRAGVAVAPLAIQSQPAQLAAMVEASGARLFFVDAGVPAFASAARRIAMDGSADPSFEQWLMPAGAKPKAVKVQPAWAFNIIYSSGTTGTPKGIVQPHAMRWAHVARADNYGYGPNSVTLLATSLCSNTTLVCFFPAIAKGGTVVLPPPKFDARTWLALAEKERATHTMLVPVQYQRIMALAQFGEFDLSSFQAKFCTSAPFRAELKADVLARWPGQLYEFYGMTEGGGSFILEAHKYPTSCTP